MSVNTVADQHRDIALEHINAAINELAAIVVQQCPGHDDYSLAYRTALRRALALIMDARQALE